jgi:hypothetical protein
MGSKAGRNPPRVQARASGRRSPSLVCDDALMDNDNWIAIMTGFEHTTSSQSTQCPNLDVRNATTVISPGNRRIAHASVPRRLHLRMGEVRSSEPAPRRPHHMQPAGQSTASCSSRCSQASPASRTRRQTTSRTSPSYISG